MHRMLLLLLMSVLGAGSVSAELTGYYKIGSQNDFFAYHRPSGTVVFYEGGFFRKQDGNSVRTAANYHIDLKEKKVLRALKGKERLKGCFAGFLKRNPNGNNLATLDNNNKSLNILDLDSGECRQVSYDLAVMKFAWSDDGKWLEFMDRRSVAFYRMDPEKMQFERLERKGVIKSLSWSSKLGKSLYVYRTSKLEDGYHTSERYEYYYVDDEGEQRKVDYKYPMTNPEEDVYFYTVYEDEESPATTFVDVKSGKVLTTQPAFYLGTTNRYAVWLKDNWVYFQGGGGVLNYRTGEFVSFGTELTPSVAPFSVSEGRYAMMYLMGEDRLMVYDLEERKYIESYEPFWRGQ